MIRKSHPLNSLFLNITPQYQYFTMSETFIN